METASVVFSDEILRFHVPNPNRGWERVVCGPISGCCASKDKAVAAAMPARREADENFIFRDGIDGIDGAIEKKERYVLRSDELQV